MWKLVITVENDRARWAVEGDEDPPLGELLQALDTVKRDILSMRVQRHDDDIEAEPES